MLPSSNTDTETNNMKIPSVRAIIATLCLSIGNAIAGETIQGAFGWEFGQVIQPNKAIATKQVSQLPQLVGLRVRTLYQFAAPVTNRLFHTYFVEITPRTHRVYRITGIGDPLNAAQQDDLKKSLQDKYARGGPTNSPHTIDQGKRYIDISNSGMAKSRLPLPGAPEDSLTSTEIRCTDEDLAKLAAKESGEAGGKSGL